jgi:outer membrane lipopolysaccharide assembly protein LptE/RlpB
MPLRVRVLLVLIAGLSTGCGYALAGRGSFLPDYIRVVGIPQFENRSQFSQLEQPLTDRVRNEFIGRGKYRVVPSATGADAVLTAEVLSVSIQPVAFNQQQLASRYAVALTLKVAFTDTSTSMVLWSNDALVFREEYELTTSGLPIEGASFVDQQRSSVDRIAGDVARSVVTSILEAF